MMDQLSTKWSYVVVFILMCVFLLPGMTFADASGIVSDDFSGDTLKTSIWTLVDPLGQGSDSMTGTHLMLTVPAGVDYDPWTSGNNSLRVMQASNNTDFQVEAKFESELTQSIQGHGIVIEESSSRFLRFDVFYLNGNLHAFAAFIDGGSDFVKLDALVDNVAPYWIRVTRAGNDWTFELSGDGTTWTTMTTFSQAITVNNIGPYVSNFNANGNPAPSYTGLVDYFFNSDTLISPEDSSSTDLTEPQISNVNVSTTDQSATITWNTDEFATSRVDYGKTVSYGGAVESFGLTTNHSMTIENLRPNTAYHYQISSTDASGNTGQSADDIFQTDPDTEGPSLWVWYDTFQKVGHIGVAQNDFNLVGNVTDASGIESLTYTLNGGSPVALTVGMRGDGYGDGKRLAGNGDFNADIFLEDLNFGSNTIVLTAEDSSGNISTESITVDRQGGSYPVSGNSVNIDWSGVSNPQNVGQYVDGLWQKESNGLRTTRPGYDRLFSIGDTTWLDYEVTVPVKINQVLDLPSDAGNPGVGILMRWKGHWVGTYRNWPDTQPKYGYQPFGGIGWLYFSNPDKNQPVIQFWHGDYDVTENYATYPISQGNTYMMKMRCETQPDDPQGKGVTIYSYKIWQEGAQEPQNWAFQYTQTSEYALRRGSFLLISHYVDATYGDVSVTLLSNAPVITSIPDTTATEDEPYSYQVEATDPDPTDVLTYSLPVAPSWLSIDSTSGLITGTPTNDDVGDTTVTVKVEDESGNIDTQTYNLSVENVNDPPVITSLPDSTATEGQLYQYQVTVDDPDAGDSLTYTLTEKPSWLSIDSTGMISGTPTNADTGDANVTVQVNDANGGSDSQSYVLNVENVNNAPVITSTAITIALEKVLYEYQVTADDPDGDDVMFFPLIMPSFLSINQQTGMISGTPQNEHVGDHTVRVVADDDNGGVTPHEYTLRVKNENDPPVLAQDLPEYSFREDGSRVVLAEDWHGYVDDPDDPDSVMIFTVLNSANISAESDTTSFTFTASPDWYGSENLRLVVSDGQLTDTSQFVVNVSAVNDAPVFVDVPDTVTFENSGSLVLAMGNYVDDKETPDNQLSWKFEVTNPALNYQFDQSSTNLTLTAPNFNGVVSLLFDVTDDSMETISDRIVVKVTGPVGIADVTNQVPTRYVLEQNYPNPFNPTTQIRFGLPVAGNVKLEVYNILGERIALLFSGYQPAGYHVVDFDASRFSSGMYIYRMESGPYVAIKRMILMK